LLESQYQTACHQLVRRVYSLLVAAADYELTHHLIRFSDELVAVFSRFSLYHTQLLSKICFNSFARGRRLVANILCIQGGPKTDTLCFVRLNFI